MDLRGILHLDMHLGFRNLRRSHVAPLVILVSGQHRRFSRFNLAADENIIKIDIFDSWILWSQ